MNFNDLTAVFVVLNVRVEALALVTVLCQEFLDLLIVKEVLLGHTEDLEGLLLGDEASLNSKAFIGNFLAKFVAMFFGLLPGIFLPQVISHFCESFDRSVGCNHACRRFIGLNDCL